MTPITRRGSPVHLAAFLAASLIGAATAWQSPTGDAGLASVCSERVLSRLYFGLDTPDGVVSDAAWQGFVDDTIAPRFDDGLTVIEARGQWRDRHGTTAKEASRVVELVHAESVLHVQRLAEIIHAYKTRFSQQAVLMTQVPVRACL